MKRIILFAGIIFTFSFDCLSQADTVYFYINSNEEIIRRSETRAHLHVLDSLPNAKDYFFYIRTNELKHDSFLHIKVPASFLVATNQTHKWVKEWWRDERFLDSIDYYTEDWFLENQHDSWKLYGFLNDKNKVFFFIDEVDRKDGKIRLIQVLFEQHAIE